MTVWVETILNSLGGNYGMKKPTTRTLSFQCLSISSQTVKKTGLFFLLQGVYGNAFIICTSIVRSSLKSLYIPGFKHHGNKLHRWTVLWIKTKVFGH